MPLIVLCGHPCSGRTRLSEAMSEYFTSSSGGGKGATIISDTSMGYSEKNVIYAESRKEKDVRGALKAEVHRLISKDDIIILDSLNYIKGYRYELYCIAKAAQTPMCVVHCCVPGEKGKLWNTERNPEDQYSAAIFDELVMRFEAPDSRNRWDSPLFTILPDSEIPFQQIRDSLFLRKPPPPNMATQSQPLSATNFLHELDKITQTVISCLLDTQKTSVLGDEITIPGSTVKINLVRSVTMSDLRKLRRLFISYTKTHPVEDVQLIATLFVQYLNKSWSS